MVEWRKTHNEELCELYNNIPDIVNEIKRKIL